MYLVPLEARLVPQVARLFYELGGYWNRPSFWSRLPLPPLEVVLNDRVLVQACLVTPDADGSEILLAIFAVADWDPRARTAQLDVAFTGLETPLGKLEAHHIVPHMEQFTEHVLGEWPVRLLTLRLPDHWTDVVSPLEWKWTTVGHLPQSGFARGAYFDSTLYMRASGSLE